MIECPECKNNISDRARVCPQCGYPSLGSCTIAEDAHIRRLKNTRIICMVTSVMFATAFFHSSPGNAGWSYSLFIMVLSGVVMVLSHLRLAVYDKQKG